MKLKFRLNSINKKIALSIFIVVALCAFISAFIISLVLGYQMTGKYRAEKEAAIESLSYSLKPVLDSNDYQQAEQIIRSSLIFENIASVAVFDNSGALVKSATEDNVAAKDLETERHSITSDGKTVGSIEVGFSRKSIDDLIQRTTIVLVVALVVFLLLTGLGLFLFMGISVIKPIKDFTRTVRKMSSDNLSLRMNVPTDDEIGMLAMSFNQMAGDLEKSHLALQEARDELEQKVELRTKGERRRAEQLRAINEVSRRISAILSLDELLPYVAGSLQETFNYYNVNIFLLAPDSDSLVLKAGASRHGGRVPAELQIPVIEGIVGKAARTGEPQNAGDVSKDPEYVPFQGQSDIRSELAIPIRIGTETLGVLDIQSIEPGAFDEIDLFTAQTLSDQLAVAIENARLYQETRDIAVLEERNRMAREIHDTLAQGFTGIVLQLEAAEQALDKDNKQVQEHLNRARALARESLNEARRSVWALRSQALEQLPLKEALRRQIDGLTRDTGMQARLSTPRKVTPLSSDIEDALLRICQEALTNVKNHAKASRVEVKLTFDESTVRLSIHDNGVGFDISMPAQNRFGLISMRERSKLLGGLTEIISENGKGTLIEVTIPINRRTP